MSRFKCEITDLHVDCLKDVVLRISAHDIGRLWMTGNVKLRKLLSGRGAARNFNFSQAQNYPVLWPRLIESLDHLVEISIEIYSRSNGGDFRIDFAALPRQLEHLKLMVHMPSFRFDVGLWSTLKQFQELQTLYLVGELSEEMEEADLGDFPNLTDFYCELTYEGNSIFFSQLVMPPTLTTLSVSISQRNLDAILEALPASLSSLTLRLACFDAIWHLLPRDLLHLRMDLPTYTDEMIVNVDDFGGLPPRLVTFSTYVLTLTPTMIRQLPESLTYLECYGIEPLIADYVELYRLLPPHLLGFDGLLDHTSVSPAMAQALPRTFKGQLAVPLPGALAHLPPNIVTLHGVAHDFSQLSRFPSLQCLSCTDFDFQWLQALPPSLQTLSFEKSDFDQHSLPLLSLSHLLQLPSRLTSLQVGPYVIHSETFSFLPPSITDLKFCVNFGGKGNNMNHPHYHDESLNHFEFRKARNSPGFGHLPPGLTRLTLCKPAGVLPMIEPVNLKQESWVSHLASLADLLHLTILSETCTFYHANWVILNLPPRLQNLNWYCYESDLENSDLLNVLPPHLKCFNVCHSPRLSLQVGTATTPALGLPRSLTFISTPSLLQPTPPSPRKQPDWLQFLLFPFKLPQILWSLWRD